MIKRFLKQLAAGLGIGLMLVVAGPAVPTHAALFDGATNEACKGTQLQEGDGECTAQSSGNRIRSIIRLALNIFSWVAGVIAVIMIIIGGLKYITSMGDSAGINNAKNTLLYAVIGLLIVAVAQVIVRFVVRKAA